jgi:hypothetical protein
VKVGETLAPHLLTGYGRRFEAGEPLRFGPLAVSVHGVHHDGGLARWEELTAIKAAVIPNHTQRVLQFWTGEDLFCYVSVGKIPNLTVLSYFLEQQRPDLWARG